VAGRRHGDNSEPGIPPGLATIDLHTHTLRSDGVLEPATLASAVAAAGVRLMAITDHDDLSAFRDLNGAAPSIPPGLELLSGVEINCLTAGLPEQWEGEIHVLGFGMDPLDQAFEAILADQRAKRRIRFERTVERLRELDLPVDDVSDAFDQSRTASLGRPTLARFLVAKGWATSVEDSFARYLGRGRPAYIPREGIGPREAIHAIRAAGGLAVLAHFSEAPERLDVIAELRELGLRGLEVYYRAFDQLTTNALAVVARDFDLVATGGSDYHGDTGSYAAAHAGLWVPPEVRGPLFAAIRGSRAPEIVQPI